jgi:hypothetical protein
MDDAHEQAGVTATTQAGPDQPMTQTGPSEEEMRAAYEAELNRITSSEMILQTAVSLLNIGGRRLGLAPPAAAGDPSTATSSERDLEQVCDAIDAVTALLPILERRMPRELGPLRDAIAQLRFAYAREVQAGSAGDSAVSPAPSAPQQKESAGPEGQSQEEPGPAQASGRLWVPGR